MSLRIEIGYAYRVEDVRAFRGPIYAKDKVVLSEAKLAVDLNSWHILVCQERGSIVSCLQAYWDVVGRLSVGGWAASSNRAAIGSLLGCYALSRRIGCASITGLATDRYACSLILSRMGGIVTSKGYRDDYGCTMTRFEFNPLHPPSRYADAIDVIFNQLANLSRNNPVCLDLTIQLTKKEKL